MHKLRRYVVASRRGPCKWIYSLATECSDFKHVILLVCHNNFHFQLGQLMGPGLLAAKSVFAKAELPHGIVRHYNECNVSGPSVADDG